MKTSKEKSITTMKDFILEMKGQKDTKKQFIDWQKRKENWINAVDGLYKIVDKIIIDQFKSSTIEVNTSKEKLTLHEDYIGSYNIDSYMITTPQININFFPRGTIIVDGYGKVDMVLARETVRLIVEKDWKTWKIISEQGIEQELIDFNEKNLVKIFQKNI